MGYLTGRDPYLTGKFASVRDEVIDVLLMNGWADDYSGDVEAPTGWFARISIGADEIESIRQLIAEQRLELPEGYDLDDLPGHYLFTEDSDGFVLVLNPHTEHLLDGYWRAMTTAYEQWLEADEYAV